MINVTKETVLLDIVEKYPEIEDLIRSYDYKLKVCMLCHCLFDSIERIESTYDIDLSDMLYDLNRKIAELESEEPVLD